MRRRLQQTIKKARALVGRDGLRKDDILLASFPKSGNTWIRFIWANMVSLMDLDGRPVDYRRLNEELVAEYDSQSYGPVEFDTMPRLVKTHKPYERRRFSRHRSVYLVRHPGDTIVSYYEYRRRLANPEKRPDTFKGFIRSSEMGLPAWCQHVASWARVATVVLRYEALWQDAFRTMQDTLTALGIQHVPEDVLRTATERSDFRQVRSLEETIGLDDQARQRHTDDFRFARRGEPGQWREYFDEADFKYLHGLLQDYDLGEAWLSEPGSMSEPSPTDEPKS